MTATTELQDQAPEVAEAENDAELILPDPGGKIVIAGKDCRVKRFRTRELLAFIRVLLRGIGPDLNEVAKAVDTKDRKQMEADLLGIMVVALPNAFDEFVDFLGTVVEPVDPDDARAVRQEMANPEPAAAIDVLGLIVHQERDELKELWGKARAWISKIAPTG